MNTKVLTIALWSGLLSLGVQAQVTNSIDGITMSSGFMNVSNLPEDGGDFQFASGWGVADLSVSFNGAGDIVTMVPNSIGDPNEYWYQNTTGTAPDPANPGGPGQRGNKSMEANWYGEATDVYNGQTLTFNGNITSLTLSNSHSVIAFIKDFSPDYSSFVESTTVLDSTGEFSISLALNSAAGRHVQWGLQMTGENVWVTDLAPFGSIVVEAIVPEDNQPPAPDPMSFAVVPFALNDNQISMTASTAVDNLFDVEYYFTCVSNNAFDSSWQSDTNYVASGLNPGSLYTFTVKARDTHPTNNTTEASAEFSATTTGADTIPPSPAMMSFDDVSASSVSVLLTAVTASDPTGVEYYFDCVSGPGNDSGWQSSPIYLDEGLSNNTAYAYTVVARDFSAAKNSNTVSSVVQISTTPLPSASITNTLQGFTGDITQPATRHDLALAGFEISENSAGKLVTFDSAGATFGSAAVWENRNTLRTIVDDYGDYSFEIAATFITSNTSEQAAFIGVGQGLVGGFGVPDFELAGVNAFVGEVQGAWAKLFTFTNGVQEALTETNGISTVINRIKLVHDSVAETVTVLVDTDYDGTFASDFEMGPHSTTNVWDDAPQRVYIAAGAGVLYKDINILSEAPPITFDVVISESVPGGGAVLNWVGALGQTYEVQYTDDLAFGNWIDDPTVDTIYDVGGPLSATSTVGIANAFYRVRLK